MQKTRFKETEIGKIPEEWGVIGLLALTSKITKGTTPTTVGGKFVKKGVNFIKVEALNDDGAISKEKFMYIDESTHELLARSKLQLNDLLYSIAGTIGRVAIVNKDILPANTNQAVAIVRPDLSKINLNYLRYALVNPEVKSYLLSKVVHAVQANLSLTEIGNCPIPIPSLGEQKSIAQILSDLDDKIELNRQMNKTLESMGQTLFKSWFVDFEFLGYEKTKFVNGLPDGWHQGTLGDIVTIESGKRPGERSEIKTSDFKVPLIGASSVMGFVKDALYKEPILIIGRVGTHGIIQRVSWPSFPSDNTLVIHTKYFEYVYQVLRTIDYNSLNVGTTQPLITQTTIKRFDILIPSNDVLKKFETCVSELFERIVANNLESGFLSGIRDSLLPKLMSGKMRVG